MYFMLDEEIYQGYKCAKEAGCQDLSVLNSSRVLRTERQTAQGPGQGGNEVGNHENVMPAMVVGRRNICPAAAGNASKKTSTSYNLRQSRVWARCENIP